MAWTTPFTAVTGTVAAAADWNTYGRDNLNFLGGTQGAAVDTSQTTTSTTYTDLATAGPAVTLTTGARALVIVSANMQNSGAFPSIMSFAVSGATTIGGNDLKCAQSPANGSNVAIGAGFVVAVNAGSNTFTAKYRVGGGTGTFIGRNITVIPLV